MMLPTLTTPRLLLRPFEMQDAASVEALAGDARVADTTAAIPHPYPPGAAEAWIATLAPDFEARRQITCAVALRDGGVLIGAMSLMSLSEEHARAEIGYWIGVPYWSHGYCTESAARLIRYAHETFGITRIVARCLARNPASARVMVKLGMQSEGRQVGHVHKNGQFEDMLMYGLNLPGRRAAH